MADIAGGEHALSGALQVLVDGDPVVDLQPGAARQLDAGSDSDPDHGEVAFDDLSRAGAHTLDGAIALECLEAVSEVELDPVLGVHIAVELADLRPEDSLVRELERVDERNLQAHRSGRSRKLAADPAGADHGDAVGRIEPLAQRVAVGQRPQVVDLAELAARNRQPAGFGASGQQQTVVRQRLPVVERDRARLSRSTAVTVVPVISSISCSA